MKCQRKHKLLREYKTGAPALPGEVSKGLPAVVKQDGPEGT